MAETSKIAIWDNSEPFTDHDFALYALGGLTLGGLTALLRLKDRLGCVVATVSVIEWASTTRTVEDPFTAVARTLWIPHSDNPMFVDRLLAEVPTPVLARLVEVARRESPPDRVPALVEALERRRGEGVGCG